MVLIRAGDGECCGDVLLSAIHAKISTAATSLPQSIHSVLGLCKILYKFANRTARIAGLID